ncbi:hypothetical protein [Prosthecobacter sp.]|uniref:hypothetical protein n=1 Tax=Prosthecobacter sp. TaxID=1965333 RepID=UPI003784612D
MKHLILLICLLTPLTTVKAGWFSKDPDPLDEAKEKITHLETQLSAQSITLNRWQITSGALGIGCLTLLIIGTALGAKTRHHYESTRRLGRTPTSTPPLNGRKPTILGKTAEDNVHSTLAA